MLEKQLMNMHGQVTGCEEASNEQND
jgi:hypothetical protein